MKLFQALIKFISGEGLDVDNEKVKRILTIILILIVLGLWINMVLRATRGHGSQYDDFTEFSQDLIFNQINLYTAYSSNVTSIGKYPPFFSAVFAPLVPLPLVVGATLWFWLSFVLIIFSSKAVIRIIWRLAGKDPPPSSVKLWAVPLVLTSVVVITNLETSQVNIFIFSLVLLALDYFSKHKDHLAGLLLGAATAIKLTPGLFIAYFFYKRSWKVVLWSVIGIIICWGVLLPLLLGFDRYFIIMQSWLETLSPFVTEGTIAEGISGFRDTNQSLSSAFRRFFTETPANGKPPYYYVNLFSVDYKMADFLIKVLKVLILIFLMYVCRAPIQNRKDPRLPFELSLIAIATLFISPISWINHYIVMILPFGAIFYFIYTRKKDDPERKKIIKILLISVFLFSMIHPFFLAFSLPFFGAVLIGFGLIRCMNILGSDQVTLNNQTNLLIEEKR